jgi:hypothetical protein
MIALLLLIVLVVVTLALGVDFGVVLGWLRRRRR